MKNTLYNDLRAPKDVQLRRIRHVMLHELTPLQREILTAVYYDGKTQAELARERGVNPSTIHRTLHRAEDRLRRFLRY